jgi:transcriptional regulator with XRE-family HTH domain
MTRRREAGETLESIANNFGVHNATISRIARGVWRREVA